MKLVKQSIGWILSIIFVVIGALMISKGFELKSITHVDGSGIGIHFLGFEVNDSVPKENISQFANSFFIASLFPFVISAAIMLLVKVNRKQKEIK